MILGSIIYILVTTITLNRLEKRGYEAMLNLNMKIAPHLNEPLYTRPVQGRTLRNCPGDILVRSRMAGSL